MYSNAKHREFDVSLYGDVSVCVCVCVPYGRVQATKSNMHKEFVSKVKFYSFISIGWAWALMTLFFVETKYFRKLIFDLTALLFPSSQEHNRVQFNIVYVSSKLYPMTTIELNGIACGEIAFSANVNAT